mmetsp:Transcript_15234/g.22311  ORF Transcript_15234/g.22311 Transcript_15234/m.22311 type:complete len:204 (-) Transcript_15234:123-734(-)|eukprot:CAMPEP_0197242138 /NCGR_PEP_ID=MMETSP1429-20130617/7974_1 /TAXON_ID=49237 /ORGANISM="Chaetoceros  sp., Strain UNC1202" /LENGTH=203 /DNA_ID=CAMNT_0042702103 /DNA_START=323 /DNA_END=934 /DNA_ORIENTATION=+
MGNGSSNGPRMAISAMAEMMKITKPQMLELRNACLRLAKPGRDKTTPTISRASFNKAMTEVKLDPVDIDIFDNLYTMWDKTGEPDGHINMLLFLAGICPLASTMDVSTKLQFALEVFDVQRTGRLQVKDALRILGGINATASYFGDAAITPQAIEIIVEDVYQGLQEIHYMDHIIPIAAHPAVVQFANAAGTMRYGGAGKAGG